MTSDADSEHGVAERPYEVLGLRPPPAPQEPAAELYWHSVGHIRSTGAQDTDLREALERLNDALYAAAHGSQGVRTE